MRLESAAEAPAPAAPAPPAATPPADEPTEPPARTVSARDARGNLRKNLKNVDTDELLSELDAQMNRDIGPTMRVTPDEDMHTSSLGKPYVGQTLNVAFQRAQAAAINRISDELEARGIPSDEHLDRIQALKEREVERKALLDEDDGGIDFRFGGLGLTPKWARNIADNMRSAFFGEAGTIKPEYPDLAAAGQRAVGAAADASHIGQERVKWVTEGQKPEDVQNFTRQGILDRLQAIADRDPGTTDPRIQESIDKLQGQIPAGFTDSDAYKTLQDRYRRYVLNYTEPAAEQAGLPAHRFVDTPTGYMRLVANRDDAPYAEDVGGTGPRARQGTRQTSAANRAEGMGDYSTDLSDIVTRDALDKVTKARKNAFYQELLKTGDVVTDPTAPVPAGKARISFDDKGNVIDDPAEARINLDVDAKVARYAKNVNKALAPGGPTSLVGETWQTATSLGARAGLAFNPKALTTHVNTLMNSLGAIPEAARPMESLGRSIAGVVPGATTAGGLSDVLRIDRSTPEMRAMESRISAAGGLRPLHEGAGTDWPAEVADRLKKALQSKLGENAQYIDPHQILNDVDRRTRLGLGRKFQDAYVTRVGPVPAEGTPAGIRYDADMAEFINKRAGNYIPGNTGALLSWLQKSHLSLFAQMSTTRLTNAYRSLVGDAGLPAATLGQKFGDRAQVIARTVGGAAVGIYALDRMIAGRTPWQSAPGHVQDIPTTLGDSKHEVDVAGRTLYPLAASAATSGLGKAIQGDAKGAVTDAVNTALETATSHPAARFILGGIGVKPHMAREGGLESVGRPNLNEGKEVSGRLKDAAVAGVGVTQPFSDEQAPSNPGLGKVGKVLGYVAPPLTTQVTADPAAARSRLTEQDATAVLQDARQRIYRAAGDTAAQHQIIADVVQQFGDEHLRAKAAAGQLQHAIGLANHSAPPKALLRFEGQTGLPRTR